MPRLLSILLALTLAAGVALRPATVAHAQPPDDQLGESLGFLVLFPQLRVLPAPLWFRPGVRVSYQVIGASFGGGGSGQGIAQYDYAGMDGGWAVANAQNLTDNGAGALIPLGGATPKIGLPAVGEYWIHPAVLVGAENVANDTLTVVRLNKQYLGQTRQVVRFESISAGGRVVWEFETTGGLLMFYSRSGGNAASQMTVLNIRTVNLPTQGVLAPNWVRPGVQMNYTGSQTQRVPSAGDITLPMAANMQIQGALPTLSAQIQQAFVNGVSMGDSANITGNGQIFGGVWLPRDALARIPQQEVILDQQDPVTGAQLRAGRTNNGLIYVREVNQAYETILYYHPVLGSLEGLQQTVASPTNIMLIELVRTGGSDLAQLNNQPELISTLLQPGITVQPNPASNQTVRVALPATTLTLGLPAGFAGEPANVTVNTVSGVPGTPAGATPAGDPFRLVVRSNVTGGPISTFAGPITLQVQLPTAVVANNGAMPAVYVHNGAAWQRLESTYNAGERTVTAAHNGGGLFAVFSTPEQGPGQGLSRRLLLPSVIR